MSDLLVPFVVGVAAFVMVGAVVGMLVAGPLDRITSPSPPAGATPTDDPPVGDEPEHQEPQQ